MLKAKLKNCYICKNNITDIDYKDTDLLRRFTSAYGKIMPKKRNGMCTRHQRRVTAAVKNARLMAFMPFVVD